MRFRRGAAAALAAGALGSMGAGVAFAATSKDTDADYTPGSQFQPLAASSPCTGAVDDPFVLPPRYAQQVVAREGDGGSLDNWDMNTQNEFGRDAGRYVYRTHENGPGTTQVTVTDLKAGTTRLLAQRVDWERFDGIVWTPHGTILAAEETQGSTGTFGPAVPDPDVPEAVAGLVYELFVDPRDPSRLNPNDPRDNVGPKDGIAVRPALGSKSHEGMRFDRRGNHYGISESSPGSIFRFVADRKSDLSEGTLQALRTENGHDGSGTWVNIPDAEARVDAQGAATRRGANSYVRPEDVETGESTGRDRNNGGNTLYVAITGTDEVLAVDLSSKSRPFAYDYVFTPAHQPSSSGAPNAPAGEFDSPDNLALDRQGNLAITEDPGGTPPTKKMGDDIFIAVPPRSGTPRGPNRRQPASRVSRFASLKDCIAEPTGIYFALEGTEEFTEGTPREALVNDETLFVNRQHAGQGTPQDQLVAIAPVRDDDK